MIDFQLQLLKIAMALSKSFLRGFLMILEKRKKSLLKNLLNMGVGEETDDQNY
jgi:hypothetical protein